MTRLHGPIFILNFCAAIVFAVLAFVAPVFSELSARMAFTELDRAGAINASALNPHDPRYAFDPSAGPDYRGTVPIFISQESLSTQRAGALMGLAVTSLTSLAVGTNWLVSRRRKDVRNQSKIL